VIGREADIQTLTTLFDEPQNRLITLTGPGGVGKTRLAVGAAAAAQSRFPGGVAWVPLASVTSAPLVLSTIALALGQRGPSDGVSGGDLQAIADRLGDQRTLLVLDNLEQVVAVAPRIAQLLSIAPRLTVLATSRAALRVSGEVERPVPPLQVEAPRAIPPAVTLFVERAKAVRPDFELTPVNHAAVAEICDRLDGLPLAIELAAARTKILSPQALLARLSHSLQLLTSGPRDAPVRLQTMRDAIRWSHDLLSDDERRLFRRLGVFAGGFSLEAAEAICQSDDEPVLDLLMNLIDQSLVVRDDRGEQFRFSLLETIREYALEELERSGDAPEIRHRHAIYFRSFAKDVSLGFMTPAEIQLMNAVEAEIANLRCAFDVLVECDPDSAANMAADLWYFFGLRGRYREGLDWLKHFDDPAPSVTELGRGRAELASAYLHWVLGEHAIADRLFRRAGGRFEQLGDTFRIGIAAHGLGLSLRDQAGRDDEALEQLQRGLEIFRADHPAWTTFTLSAIGAIHRRHRQWDKAIEVLEEGRATSIASGFTGGLIPILLHLGAVAREQGKLPEAAGYFLEAMPLWVEARDPHGAADCMIGLAAVLARIGGDLTPMAISLHAAAQTLYESVGLPNDPWEFDEELSALRGRVGDAAYGDYWQRGIGWSVADAARALQDLDLTSALSTRATTPAPAKSSPLDEYALTARELEILTHLASGKSNIEIGEALFISHRTVGTHVTNIFEKLGVNSRAAATALAMRSGLEPGSP
jgi:non-specific serine/threonine protein kinase